MDKIDTDNISENKTVATWRGYVFVLGCNLECKSMQAIELVDGERCYAPFHHSWCKKIHLLGCPITSNARVIHENIYCIHIYNN